MTQKLAAEIKHLREQRQEELRAQGLPNSTPHRNDREIDRLTDEMIAIQEYVDEVAKMDSHTLIRAHSINAELFTNLLITDEGFRMASHKEKATNNELIKRLDGKQ